MRELLRYIGINVEQRQGLYISKDIANALLDKGKSLRNKASKLVEEYKLQGGRTVTMSSSPTSEGLKNRSNDTGSFWRRVDAVNRRFSEDEKYSGILAESLNLTDTRNAYITYCKQKDFSRQYRVGLVFAVFKGLALNFWMLKIDGNPEYSEYGAIFKALEEQFNTSEHQPQIEALAQAMITEDIRRSRNCSRIEALEIWYHEVTRLNQQFAKVKRRSEFKVQALMKIVEKYEWSRSAGKEVIQEKLN